MSSYQTSESFFATGVHAVNAQVVWEHSQQGSGSIQFGSKKQATAFMAWAKKQKTQEFDFKHGPKLVVTGEAIKPNDKPHVFIGSGKSAFTLVDELAETTARKIAAKPLLAREEYFNALRDMLQQNLPKRIVSTVSDGVTVVGKTEHIIRLTDNAWTLQTGPTGKPKRIGATFDIADLLGMIDKSILR